jgi:integrase
MKEQRKYAYSSSIAPFIEGLIDEKRASGYSYSSSANVLKELDTFCLENNSTCTTVTKELADVWSIQRPTEGLNARNIRVGILRQLSKYLLSLGIDSYLPHYFPSKETSIAHVFSGDERLAFFESLDTMPPNIFPFGQRILNECRVLFRLYYCCGMRLSEPLMLIWECVDLEARTIRILQSKGDKDRILFLTDDIIDMLRKYEVYIHTERPGSSWVFPGTREDNHLNDVTVRDYFLKAWNRTPYAGMSNPPTIKSFRHTFVVDRLNSWMLEGDDVQEKLPYLCKYLGHASINESLYYYHQVSESFRIIREKDKTSDQVIPEVNFNEQKND